jgi:hypothetical protein
LAQRLPLAGMFLHVPACSAVTAMFLCVERAAFVSGCGLQKQKARQSRAFNSALRRVLIAERLTDEPQKFS